MKLKSALTRSCHDATKAARLDPKPLSVSRTERKRVEVNSLHLSEASFSPQNSGATEWLQRNHPPRRISWWPGLIALALGLVSFLRAHPNHASPFQIAALAPRPPPAGGARADARLTMDILDARSGRPTAARIRITDDSGKPVGLPMSGDSPLLDRRAAATRLAAPGSVPGLPSEAVAVMYGMRDQADGFAFQPDGAFFVAGRFSTPLPAGRYRVAITKGYEFLHTSEEIVLAPGQQLAREVRLARWADLPARGWYSADDHIHIRRSPRENPPLAVWLAAEDVHVGVFLEVGDFWATYFTQYAWGEKGVYEENGYMLASGQEEPRTEDLGHTISIGAREFVRFADDYYAYDRVFDRIHALGGVTGYAHQGMTFYGYRGMTLDVLAQKLDFLELMQFCAQQGPLAVEHYYLFLDLGFKLTALAGSDFPWCGRKPRYGTETVGPQIGDARFYTYTGGALTYSKWLGGVKAGHTFVTTGPMLEFTVNGQIAGSSLDVRQGERLRISAVAHGHERQVPLQRLQIIAHGKVIGETTASQPGQNPEKLALELDVPAEHGVWIAARVDAGPAQMAHTTPVYVTVNQDGFHHRGELKARIETARRHLQEIRTFIDPAAPPRNRATLRSTPLPSVYRNGRAHLERRIAEAEAVLERLQRR
jgi:hypothetical protein